MADYETSTEYERKRAGLHKRLAESEAALDESFAVKRAEVFMRVAEREARQKVAQDYTALEAKLAAQIAKTEALETKLAAQIAKTEELEKAATYAEVNRVERRHFKDELRNVRVVLDDLSSRLSCVVEM